ncbi:DNA-directed RNA polymerase III subunit RPC8 [Heracleum sosnowskyi]|uniref:DNA-directed RNA polymerase subunit n=1 Tax=Heracleum sosnowskyi TaxID=360622 RepID=A0AAD8LXG5_9APIA|nr:DNA-directed RNA polymerase III subunit RPC8 [Heracleum sosnowskyi]
MFYLSEIEHTMRVPPHLLNLPLNDAIKGELERLFLDKVVANLGLVISVYDIKSIDGGFVFPSDGASTYTVKFRLVIFRPFVGEVVTAKLLESTANGLRLSLGFFDDIYVPVHLMPNPSHSEADPVNKNQVAWIWEYQDENYAIDGVDEIRFRVNNIRYPPIPIEADKESNRFAPMVITGSLDADGLGPVSWWV